MTLDDYMRRLWRDHGRAGSRRQKAPWRGPYTAQHLRDVLAEVSGDRRFANEFFDRYIEGRGVVDYSELLSRARVSCCEKSSPGRPWIGPVTLDFSGGSARVSAPTIEDTPVYVCRTRSRRRRAVV